MFWLQAKADVKKGLDGAISHYNDTGKGLDKALDFLQKEVQLVYIITSLPIGYSAAIFMLVSTLMILGPLSLNWRIIIVWQIMLMNEYMVTCVFGK